MKFHWRAEYRDGTCLNQFNEDGSENKYPDIDRSKLEYFVLVNEDQFPAVVLHFNPERNQRLICRLRTHIAGMSGRVLERVWLVGWQETRNGTNTQKIFFVFSDGHIEVTDRFDNKHPWYYSPNLRPEEMENKRR